MEKEEQMVSKRPLKEELLRNRERERKRKEKTKE